MVTSRRNVGDRDRDVGGKFALYIEGELLDVRRSGVAVEDGWRILAKKCLSLAAATTRLTHPEHRADAGWGSILNLSVEGCTFG